MLYTYIMMLPVTAVLFWLFLFLKQSKEKLRHQWVFIVLMLMMLIGDFYTAHIIGKQPVGRMIYILDYVDCFVIPAIPPLFYIHIKRLALDDKITWKDSLFFIPTLILFFSNLILGLQVGYSDEVTNRMGEGFSYINIDYTDFSLENMRWFVNAILYDVVLVCQLVPMIISLAFILKRYHNRLENFYANIEEESYIHMRNLLLWGIVFAVLTFCLVSVSRWYIANHQWLAVLFMIAAAANQYQMCSNAYYIEFSKKDLDEATADDEELDEGDALSEENKTENAVGGQSFYTRVEKILNEWSNRADKPYLVQGITLAIVAKDCHLPQRMISNYLNSICNKNFNTWINEFRAEEAKKLLLLPDNLTMIDIAYRCGMPDAAMLSRLFKKYVGCTPSEYRNQHMS